MRDGAPKNQRTPGLECLGTPASSRQKASHLLDPTIEAAINRSLDTFVTSAIRMLDDKRMHHDARRHHMLSEERDLIDMHAVIAKTGLSRSSIYRAIENAGFPSPVPMSSSRSGYGRRLFIRHEVEAWVQKQIAKCNDAS